MVATKIVEAARVIATVGPLRNRPRKDREAVMSIMQIVLLYVGRGPHQSGGASLVMQRISTATGMASPANRVSVCDE